MSLQLVVTLEYPEKRFYKWIDRYKKYGDTGLSDHSKKPINSPRSTSKDVISKILYLRQNYILVRVEFRTILKGTIK